MGFSDSEGADYDDDDFEQVSEDEGGLSRAGTASRGDVRQARKQPLSDDSEPDALAASAASVRSSVPRSARSNRSAKAGESPRLARDLSAPTPVPVEALEAEPQRRSSRARQGQEVEEAICSRIEPLDAQRSGRASAARSRPSDAGPEVPLWARFDEDPKKGPGIPRPVRGRVGVERSDDAPSRLGTGDSVKSGGGRPGSARRLGTGDSGHAPPAVSSTPIWLQKSEPTHKPARGEDRVFGGGHGHGGHRPESNLGFARRDSGSVQRGSDLGPRGNGGGRAGGRGMSRDPFGEDEDMRTGTADGADRKVVRLQSEVKRLMQRLQEAELHSLQDEGLPVFNLDEVEIGCQIAQGGFSSVHHGTWRYTPVAVKKIFDPVITDELLADFNNEVKMLRRLRHPHVVTLMAVCRTPPSLSILTEMVSGGSLFELLHGRSQTGPEALDCEPSTVLPIVQQSAIGLAFLHEMMVVHRDVKSHNVLLTSGRTPIAKLCDFGLARMKSELCIGTMQYAGTAAYMPPELFAKKRYNEAVDVFALGVMLWEAVSTEIPHANLEPQDIAHRVQKKDGGGLPVTHSWPKSLKAVLPKLMAVLAEHRPPMGEAVTRIGEIILDFPPADR